MLQRIRTRLLGLELPPQYIGRYRVLRERGRGGSGRVLECLDEKHERHVAIKVMDSPERSAAAVRREASATAAVVHPRVVRVHESGVHEGRPFIVMQLVDGIPLRVWQRRDLPWTELVRVYAEVGRGLSAAHAAGVVHRDIKPDNVIIDADGNPTIVDFGLAQPSPHDPPTETAVTASHHSQNPGTPGYVAPEQLRGERADEKSDQYALAASLFEALYGTLPYPGRDAFGIMLAVHRGELRGAPKGHPAPRRLHAVLKRALSRNPPERWESVAALTDALNAVLLAEQTATRRRWRVLFAVALTGGLLGGAWLAS